MAPYEYYKATPDWVYVYAWVRHSFAITDLI